MTGNKRGVATTCSTVRSSPESAPPPRRGKRTVQESTFARRMTPSNLVPSSCSSHTVTAAPSTAHGGISSLHAEVATAMLAPPAALEPASTRAFLVAGCSMTVASCPVAKSAKLKKLPELLVPSMAASAASGATPSSGTASDSGAANAGRSAAVTATAAVPLSLAPSGVCDCAASPAAGSSTSALWMVHATGSTTVNELTTCLQNTNSGMKKSSGTSWSTPESPNSAGALSSAVSSAACSSASVAEHLARTASTTMARSSGATRSSI
mmetsp:Transcript_14227/g.39194  ORF Transcript_14227/g.39194 Transcript_14227/m.39194 type:complete len:267 (+) Transcript_14227:174-974(+)